MYMYFIYFLEIDFEGCIVSYGVYFFLWFLGYGID